MTDQNLSLALDNAVCIKKKIHFTETFYHNVCNGNITAIDNSIADYFFIGALSVLLFIAVYALIVLVGELKDIFI